MKQALPIIALLLITAAHSPVHAKTNQLKLYEHAQAICTNQSMAADTRLAACTQALQFRPQRGDLWAERGQIWRGKNELAKAIADFTTALKFEPQSGSYFFDRAYTWEMQKNFPKALEDYSMAIQLLQQSPVPSFQRGLIYFYEYKDYQAAYADFSKAIELYGAIPDSGSYVLRGLCSHYQEKYDLALADFAKGIEYATSGDHRPYLMRSYTWLHIQEYEKALQDAQTVLEYTPEEHEAYLVRTYVWMKQRKYENARKDVAIVLNKDPEKIWALRDQAWLLALEKQYPQALQQIQTALSLRPNDPVLLNLQGWIYYLQGNTDAARIAFEKVWPQIKKPQGWGAFIEDYLPVLTQRHHLDEHQKQQLSSQLQKAKSEPDKAALIAFYQVLLNLK